MKKLEEKLIEKDGIQILVKSQKGLKKGQLTKSVYKNSSKETVFEKNELSQVRELMGWNNLDLSDRGIRTSYKNIPNEEFTIPVRIYESSSKNKKKPCIVFFHGGGFFGGSLKTVENPCKFLAQEINGIVVSVDYRLAPENYYPKGLEDCYKSVEWVYENAKELGVDKRHIGVSGDSAGGNLAAVCALKDKNDRKSRIKFQALLYPVVNVGNIENDYYVWKIEDYDIEGPHKKVTERLTRALGNSSGLLTTLYLNDNLKLLKDHYVSPIFANDLSNMPMTLLINAEFDYLRVEGEAYLKRLSDAGNEVSLIRYRGVDHAFMDKLGDYPEAEDCMIEIAKAFKRVIKLEKSSNK